MTVLVMNVCLEDVGIRRDQPALRCAVEYTCVNFNIVAGSSKAAPSKPTQQGSVDAEQPIYRWGRVGLRSTLWKNGGCIMSGNAATVAYEKAVRVVREPARVAAVRATGLLDSETEEVFDRLTRLAVKLLNIPTAFISLVDEHRDFYKSASGFGEPLASARELKGPTFCHYAIQSREPLIINDAASHPVYREIPTVKSLGVAAYVGVPLVTADGHVLGSFCAIDVKPREWSTLEIQVLTELATSAKREITLRQAIRVTEQLTHEVQDANVRLEEEAVELEQQIEEARLLSHELQSKTEEAERANQAKSDFLTNMSHELRTPLNAIGGYVELLQMGIRGPVTPEQLADFDRIQRNQRHLLSLINDVLNFARLGAGQIEYHLETVPLDAALRDVEAMILPQIRSKGIAYLYEGCDAALAVRADREKLQQIVLNLLSNAIKFTETGGSISVECKARDAIVKIDVADTGIGIPANKVERVFEPFVQVKNGSGAQSGGTGLGLAISRDLARGMGGDVTGTSELGVGSTFTLNLPTAVE